MHTVNNVVVFSIDGLNFVKMRYGVKELKLLIDSGANVSLVFKENLEQNEYVNKNRKVKIRGIAGSTESLGTANLLLSVHDVEIGHDFLIVKKFSSDIDGIIGTDFLTRYASQVDYETFLFSFWYKGRQICLPLQSSHDYEEIVPARCEVIKYFPVNMKCDCVVMPEEVCNGVFVAGVVNSPKDGMIPVRLLNVNERDIRLRNYRPKVDKLTNFELCMLGKSERSIDRIERVLDSINLEGLHKEERTSIEKICAKYADVFHLEGERLTVTNVSQQNIYLRKNASPVYAKPYRLPYSQKAEIHKQVEQMLHDGIIEESKSEWSSPLLIVPKKADANGEKRWRIVVDYRLLNKLVKDDKFPLPSISEILDSLSGAKLFSHLDLSNSYYQCELNPSSRPYTAFTTDRGLFQMKRLPMGLKSSPGSFSRCLAVAMSGLNYESCFQYLDDIVVFGNNMRTHNQNLIKVLERLRATNFKLNPTKCVFMKRQMLYLGHVISSAGILPDPQKLHCIENYPVPKNGDETKRFVAFANYYRKFINHFAHITQPLNNLTRKNATFNWTTECQNAFETIKNCLMNPPILQYPDLSENNKFILRTDASGCALGAILSNGNDSPVAYASRSLNKAERNYCTIEKELLGIVWAVKHFRPYLYGRKFDIFCDHRPLVYLFGMTNPSSRLTKFRLTLEEYDFTIHYVKGSENVTADALSRIKIESSELKDINDSVVNTMFVLTRAQSKKQNKSNSEHLDTGINTSKNDRPDQPVIVELLKRPLKSIELRPISSVKFNEVRNKILGKNSSKNINENTAEYFILNNLIFEVNSQILYLNQNPRSARALDASLRDLRIICAKYKIPELCIIKTDESELLIQNLAKETGKLLNAGLRICIIKSKKVIDDYESKQLILNDFHMLASGGHAGINRMANNIKKYYFWSGMGKDIEKFVRHCDDCQRHKHSKLVKEPLSITTTASTAFQKVYLDLVGPLSPDVQENRYILTLQCELSKFVEAYPIVDKEAPTVARSFVENFILRYGIPKQVVTDQGTEFMAAIFQETCKTLDVKHLNSTAYHHETLGALENSHKNLGSYLRIQLSKHSNAWSSWIPFWCFAYNNTVHTETKYTPHELVFGRPAQLPSNIKSSIDPLYNFDNYPLELKYRLQVSWEDAKNNLIASKNIRKTRYDAGSVLINYKAGDKVLLRNNPTSKTEQLYKGPYVVVDEKSPNITLNINNKLVVVHKNRIKPYFTNK